VESPQSRHFFFKRRGLEADSPTSKLNIKEAQLWFSILRIRPNSDKNSHLILYIIKLAIGHYKNVLVLHKFQYLYVCQAK